MSSFNCCGALCFACHLQRIKKMSSKIMIFWRNILKTAEKVTEMSTFAFHIKNIDTLYRTKM